MKKAFALVLVLSIILTSTLCVSAQENSTTIQPAQQVTAQLVDDLGNSTSITGYLIDSYNARSLNTDSSVTYAYQIYENQLIKEGSDSTLSSRVILTIFYNTYTTSSGDTAYLLTRVSGSWAIQDAHVTVPYAHVRYTCQGVRPNGLPFINQTQDYEPTAYLCGFNITTGFNEYVISGVMGILGATMTLNYERGSRTWTFVMQNNLFNT